MLFENIIEIFNLSIMEIFFFLMFDFSSKWYQMILFTFFDRSQITIAFINASFTLLSHFNISAHYFIEFFVNSIRHTFLFGLVIIIIISSYVLVFWIYWICLPQHVYLHCCILFAIQVKQFVMLFIWVSKGFHIYVFFL